MEIRVTGEDADSYEEVMLIYQAALRQMETKLAVLNEEFRMVHKYNPIEHITSRVKKSESIAKKLRRHGYDVTLENMVKYCNDIAGVRVICSFTSDIYRIADMISNQSDIRVLAIKDYIASPKPSGYRSYHMIVMIPVYLSDRIVDTKAEIQIRTIAMDFWASLEHQLRYKTDIEIPDSIRHDLTDIADDMFKTDLKMSQISRRIQRISRVKHEAQELAKKAKAAEAGGAGADAGNAADPGNAGGR